MDSSKEIKLGSILSYAQIVIKIIVGIVYTPIMLRLLGKSDYGLYNTVASTISMLGILSFGFNSGYIKYFSKYKKEKDELSIDRLNGLFMLVFSVIGVIALLCGLFLTFNLNIVFDKGLTASEYGTARILMVLFTLNLAISFPMSVFQSIISAHEKFVVLKLLAAIKSILSPIITIPLLFLGYGVIGLVVVTVLISVAVDIAYLVYCFKYLKIGFRFDKFEKGLFSSLFGFTFFVALTIIADQVNNSVDKVLITRYLGTKSVAVYSVGYALYDYYITFSSSIAGLFAPKVFFIYNEGKTHEEKNKSASDLFIKVGRIQFIILGLIASGVVFFGKEFIKIWAGKGYGDAYFVTVLLVITGTVHLIQNVGIEIQRAQNKHNFRGYAYVGMVLINIILTVILTKKYGIIGAAIATAAAFILVNGVAMNIHLSKSCGINISAFWLNILRMSAGLIIPILTGTAIMLFVDNNSILSFAATVILYVTVYCLSMWFFGMNDYERQLLSAPVKRILHR